MGNKYREVLDRASSFLESFGVERYNILFVFLEKKNWSKTDWLLHLNECMPQAEQEWVQTYLEILATDYPPQYLLGYSDFYGYRLSVNEHTLIPRPETEELVEKCLKENDHQPVTVVDVGTGSGAIAISLKLQRPSWQILAVDLSKKALDVAKKNAQSLQADVSFLLGDTLNPVEQKVDLIVSNPPYIDREEKKYMDRSVQRYEPEMALFAENNGLAIYQKLAKQAQKRLKPQGKLYLEIGFQQGPFVQSIYQHAFPEKNVRIEKDLSGHDRMVIVDGGPTNKKEGTV